MFDSFMYLFLTRVSFAVLHLRALDFAGVLLETLNLAITLAAAALLLYHLATLHIHVMTNL